MVGQVKPGELSGYQLFVRQRSSVCLCQLTRIWESKEPTSRAQGCALDVSSSLPNRLVVVELFRLIPVFCKFGSVLACLDHNYV